MAIAEGAAEPPREGTPAPLARLFGWGSLAVLAAFFVNNILTVSFGFPGAWAGFSGGGALGFVQFGLYIVTLGLAAAYVLREPTRALRWDARRIASFNAFLVRACFWIVLYCGVVDAAVAFLRVEQFFGAWVGEDLARSFGISRFVGVYVHVPLAILGVITAFFTRTLGFTWLALLIVVAELLIVISRFVFSYEQALMGDLVRYWYAALFLFASAYTLIEEGHVRVDVFYAGMNPRAKGRVNALGSILLGMTTCWVIIWIGFDGRTSIFNAPVLSFEVTQTGGTGMFIKYQMALFLAVFAITMLIQFVSYLFEAVADWRDEPGRVEHEAVSH